MKNDFTISNPTDKYDKKYKFAIIKMNPSFEADNSSDSPEISHLLRKARDQYRLRKSPSLGRLEMNPVCIITP
jgi:hypothetical protein